MQGVVSPARKGSIAASPQGSYWAETPGGTRGCRAFSPQPSRWLLLRCLCSSADSCMGAWAGAARGVPASESLQKGLGVTPVVHRLGSCAAADCRSRVGAQELLSMLSLLSWGGPGLADLSTTGLTPHSLSSLGFAKHN